MDDEAVRDAKRRVQVGYMLIYDLPNGDQRVICEGHLVTQAELNRGVLVKHDAEKARVIRKGMKVLEGKLLVYRFRGSITVFQPGMVVRLDQLLAGSIVDPKPEEVERVCK